MKLPGIIEHCLTHATTDFDTYRRWHVEVEKWTEEYAAARVREARMEVVDRIEGAGSIDISFPGGLGVIVQGEVARIRAECALQANGEG